MRIWARARGLGPSITRGRQGDVLLWMAARPVHGQAKFHKGVDLRAAYGQDVQAAGDGRVVFSGPRGLRHHGPGGARRRNQDPLRAPVGGSGFGGGCGLERGKRSVRRGTVAGLPAPICILRSLPPTENRSIHRLQDSWLLGLRPKTRVLAVMADTVLLAIGGGKSSVKGLAGVADFVRSHWYDRLTPWSMR
jgi:hypothetical protein